MAEAAVSFLMEKTEQILKYYINLVSDAENELRLLEKELRLLKSFLQDAAQVQKKEAAYREMERQIREVVYEAEDTIDVCLTHGSAGAAAAPAGKRKKFFAFGRNVGRAVDIPKKVNLAEQVKSLRESKVKPLIQEVKMRIGSGSGSSAEPPSSRVKKPQLIRQDNIVGFEDEEETLINYLMEEREKLDVISLIGMPGLGKTTLAWKIFQNPTIKYKFPVRHWVYVSQEFSIRDVLLNILKHFRSGEDMSNTSDLELVQTVRSFLENTTFLLVMDDVWTPENWTDIRSVLPMNNGMGKVLITSRHENVGRHANVTREPHMLRFLTLEESWKLLQLEVFGNVKDCPPQLRQRGEYIAKQCDGLPLAIVVIGGILVDQFSTKRRMSEILEAWQDVSQNVGAYVKNKKAGNSILDIVAMSYNNLPHDLKDCFVYLGVFPEDYEIPVWTLTRLWIAEGFIQDHGQGLEKTAEENLKDLINRNLVMAGTTNPNGELKTCRVHDLIREFCISKAAPTELDMFQEIKKSKQGVFDPPFSDRQTYHRLCIHSHLPDFLSGLFSGHIKLGRGVRSFLCLYKEPFVLNPKYDAIIPDTFDLLRVLDSNSFKFTRFPIKVTKLIHMRYLTLSFDIELDSLPEAIVELWNLQTLVIDTKSRRLEIKADIWKMFRLRHLKTKAAIVLNMKGEAADNAGENLQTLSSMSPECCTIDVFKKARNLKKLGVRGSLATLFNANSLEQLDLLENLKLVNDLYYESASEKPLRSLPQPHCFPPNIKRLTLSATYLDWKHISTLAMIDTLQVLKLKDYAFKGEFWTVDGGFNTLQVLIIVGTDLVSWQASDDQFPSLICLVLKNCQNLNQIPLGLAKTLQTLEIERVTKSAVQSANKIQEKKMQGYENARWGGFKLSIGPGCE